MAINSRAKGAVGERELAKFLTDRGFPATRGQQFAGGTDSPDVVCLPLRPFVHLECKRVEKGSLYEWLEQAKRDAAAHQVPVVAHRRNGKEWVAIMPLDRYLEMLKWMT